MSSSTMPATTVFQSRRLASVFPDQETCLSMHIKRQRNRGGFLFTKVLYEVKHEHVNEQIISNHPKRAVDLLMVKLGITTVEQYCRIFNVGGAA